MEDWPAVIESILSLFPGGFRIAIIDPDFAAQPQKSLRCCGQPIGAGT
jgi:hypothetical protein